MSQLDFAFDFFVNMPAAITLNSVDLKKPMLPCWVTVLIVVAVAVLLICLIVWFFLNTKVGDAVIAMLQKINHQRFMYRAAQKRAQELGRKLLVIGDPRAPKTINARLPGYKCGDICLDLRGCTKCKKGVTVLKMDILEGLRKLGDNSVVVYESETLEFIPSEIMKEAVEEINRVSGGEIFATHFVGQRTRFLTDDYKKHWKPMRLIVLYPPAHKEYVWIEQGSISSWQADTPKND